MTNNNNKKKISLKYENVIKRKLKCEYFKSVKKGEYEIKGEFPALIKKLIQYGYHAVY